VVEVQTVHAGELGAGRALPRAGDVRLVRFDEAIAADVDARPLVARGLAPESELGVALAGALACLRGGAGRVVVRLALGNDFLMQVAKLRALRLLWARLVELGAEAELVVWAEPSAFSWTAYDPWVNLLRNTTGCFAAIVGGADWVTPLPYDLALATPDALARRLAENTVHVLLHEGQLGWPADPAAGSWAIEAWTEALAAAAWEVVRHLEEAGPGFDVASLSHAAARHERIVKRLDGIIGTSLYPNPTEPLAVGATAALGPRAAEPFERLRPRGARASVFLVCLGPLAEHSVRALWAKGLYEVAAMRVVMSEPLDSVAAAVAAWRASGAPVAVLCGTDQVYGEHGAAYVAGLHEAGARVVLAGRPRGLELAVDQQIYAGMDVVAALEAELAAQGAVA